MPRYFQGKCDRCGQVKEVAEQPVPGLGYFKLCDPCKVAADRENERFY